MQSKNFNHCPIKKIHEFRGMLNFLRKYVYKMQLYLKPLYNILRQQNNF